MAKAPQSENLFLDGPAGRLEALIETPADVEVRACAVILHPHPQHGGTLQNKVAHTLARTFTGLGFAALRFNFRGTGESEGSYAEGEGERADALAAVQWLRARVPGRPLWLAGFSFGAAVAIRAAAEAKPAGLVTVAPAVRRFVGRLDRQPESPWLVVQGDADEVVDIDETVSWLDGLEPGPELVVLPGVGHFFHGRLNELKDTVAGFVAAHLAR